MYVKSLLSFIFIEILSFKDMRFFNPKNKNHQIGEALLETPGLLLDP